MLRRLGLAGLPLLSLLGSAHADSSVANDARCNAMRELVIDRLVYETVVGHPNGGFLVGGVVGDAGGEAPPSRVRLVYKQPVGPSHHTTTNVQEPGVDEADIVKTDGRYLYTVYNSELVIAKTWPVASTDVAARVKFSTIQPTQLYLRGDEVVIQGTSTTEIAGFAQGGARVIVVDVKNPTSPRIKRVIDVEGTTLSSRVVGNDLYLVQHTSMRPPARLETLAEKVVAKIPPVDEHTLKPWEVETRIATTLRKAIGGSITQADVEGMLPKIRAGSATRRIACSDLFIPPDTTQLEISTLARVSLSGDKTDLVGAFVAGTTVYASTDALYLASPHYTYNQQGSALFSTQVHMFALGTKQTRPAYVASGKVLGQVLDQFSMSEHKGDLRIATTDWTWNGEQGGNNLFVMRPYGRELRTIGALEGLAKGERIYSGRMLGDKGYLVTFRKTDPLFTLDLSDPFKPRAVGELKINGFSSYIHPIGGDLLLTIGQDAGDQGRVTGLHVQVFDVSNPAKPTRKFHEKLAPDAQWSTSTAMSDHHAFMYDPVTGTLAFPIQTTGKEDFNGLAVYHLDPKRGFQAKGRLDHHTLADVAAQQTCEQMKKQNPHYAHTYCDDAALKRARAQYPITRSMIVDKYIVSLSPVGLEIHELSDLGVAATLSWVKVQKRDAVIAR